MKYEELLNEFLKDEKFRKEYNRFDLWFEIRQRYTEMRMEFGLPHCWWLKPWNWKNYKRCKKNTLKHIKGIDE